MIDLHKRSTPIHPLLNALLLTGGMYHDVDGFEAVAKELLTGSRYAVELHRQGDGLRRLSHGVFDCVVLYTCWDPRIMNPALTEFRLTREAVDTLTAWVHAGGHCFAIHGATVGADLYPGFAELLGASFIGHPPQTAFEITPCHPIDHPIIVGIKPFTVNDELYLHRMHALVNVLLTARYKGEDQPILWEHEVGKGRVVYNALGHDPGVWNHPVFRDLFVRGTTIRSLLKVDREMI
jgi:type 1 glutamine amidotransferase